MKLTIQFDDSTPATWNRTGREAVRRRMARFKGLAEQYKARLHDILLESRPGTFAPGSAGLLFRWASAGALPIINMGTKEYYCLFYREVFPIGWNIANGATDTSAELLDPLQALERELGEELVIVDKTRKERYVLRPDRDTLLDRPEFSVFRRFWSERFPRLDISRFKTAPLPLYWEKGPDRIEVTMRHDGHDRQTRTLTGCFVNINTEDCGIELDRIARITINDRVVLCDGEVAEYRALNRAVGLFEVGRLQSALASGGTEFVPDFVYLGGVRYKGDNRIQQYVRHDLPREIRKWRSKQDVDRFVSTTARLDLCPVTRSIVRRHIESGRRMMPNPPAFDVFISYESSDERLAQRLYDALCSRRLHVFLAPQNREKGTFLHRVHHALASTRAFVAVASRSDAFMRGWPEWELEAFTMAHGASPNSARIVNFVEGVDPLSLPLLLKGHDIVDCKLLGYKTAVGRLVRLL